MSEDQSTSSSSSPGTSQNANESAENSKDISDSDQNSACLTLENSTLSEIPNHTRKVINDLLKLHNNDKMPITKFSLFNSLLISIGLECGFCSDSAESANYRFNSNFAFDKFILANFAHLPHAYNSRTQIQKLTFKFINDPSREIVLVVMDTGDFVLITALINFDCSFLDGSSLILPLSRYVPLVFTEKIEKSFRNLKELSMRVKNCIFLPLRNEIYRKVGCLNPSLFSLPEIVLRVILKYLAACDIRSFSSVCRRFKEICDNSL